MDEFEEFEKLQKLFKIERAENTLKNIMYIMGALFLGIGIAIMICMEKGFNTKVLEIIGIVLIILYMPIKVIWFMLGYAKSNILDEKEDKKNEN